MDETNFWALIEESRPKAVRTGLLKRRSKPDLDGHREALVERLVEKGPDEILAFDRIWSGLSSRAYRNDLWEAAYVINGGCSDDCFDYFRDYLISLGGEVYEAALRDPESLADVDLPHDEVDHESVSGVAYYAWERLRGDEPLPSEPAPGPREPAGEFHDEEELPEMYPRLAARFGFK